MTAQRWPRVWTQGLTPTTATPMLLRRAFGQHVSETAARPLTPRPPEGPLTHSDPLRRPGPTAGVQRGASWRGARRGLPRLSGAVSTRYQAGARGPEPGRCSGSCGRAEVQRPGLGWDPRARGAAGAFVSALRPGRAANARVCSHSARAPTEVGATRGRGRQRQALVCGSRWGWGPGSDHSPDSACPRRPCPLKSDLAGASGRRAWDDNPL